MFTFQYPEGHSVLCYSGVMSPTGTPATEVAQCPEGHWLLFYQGDQHDENNGGGNDPEFQCPAGH
jgi:hypothetical protein